MTSNSSEAFQMIRLLVRTYFIRDKGEGKKGERKRERYSQTTILKLELEEFNVFLLE